MASFALKVVDEAKEQLGSVAASTKQAAIDAKVQVDLVVAKVRGQTWSEPLGKACSVTGAIVSGLGNFVPGLGIVGGALALGGTLLNPKASLNDVRREQEPGCNTLTNHSNNICCQLLLIPNRL